MSEAGSDLLRRVIYFVEITRNRYRSCMKQSIIKLIREKCLRTDERERSY